MITVQDYYEPTQPTLLFSLHPEPAQAIEAGTKRIEYRRRFYHQEPFQAFVHVTGTHGGIGLFLQISQPLVAAPNRLLANLTATDATAIRNLSRQCFPGCCTADPDCDCHSTTYTR
ncbi:hypothetical protein [Levilactobacillus brevis]|uniref:hypothetical protein n=1 Tax=Levilactobacillus brevis TaxID=1580 RepID=UPI002013C098|nr:hypothetical protein [Levilactobacillus brevis]